MSNIGDNPKVKFLNLTPLSADPTNPEEGDIQYSDGTARLEGPWVYQNGAWQQFSTGAALSTVNEITFTPQSSDPGSPSVGTTFYSDGTTRTEGFWFYNGTDWVQTSGARFQEFTHKARFQVRSASTANVALASEVEAGDSFGGVTLVNGDLVLLKNQTVSSENGVYVVQVSGAPIRDTSYNSAEELTLAQIHVLSGTNANQIYFQANTLTTLADAQSWSTTVPSFSFTVPQEVYELEVAASGGGGGGGAGCAGYTFGNFGGSGGGGGGGSFLQSRKLAVSPGDVITLEVGIGGKGGPSQPINTQGVAGTTGLDSRLTTTSSLIATFPGAGAGGGGAAVASSTVAGGAGGSSYTNATVGALGPFSGGQGGDGTVTAVGDTGDTAEIINAIQEVPTTAAVGGIGASVSGGQTRPGGGGGGASSNFGIGGDGGNAGTTGSVTGKPGDNAPASNYGAGGGGGGAGNSFGVSGMVSGAGGWGADGYIRLSWK